MRRVIILAACLLLITACSLLEGPQTIVIPTPLPTAPPLASQLDIPTEAVINPTTDVTYGVDPEIQVLLNEVSTQNLFAYVQTMENFGTRSTFSVVDRSDFGIGAARLWIFNQFVAVGNGRLQVRFDDFPANIGGRVVPQQNVVAVLPGTSGSQNIVVMVAHYDSRGVDPFDGSSRAPGANDNASGVALMLEMARILGSRSWTQTIVFVATAAEEQGRFGSRHFVQNVLLNSNGSIDATINNDIIGGRPGIERTIRVFAPGDALAPSQHLGRYIKFVGGLYIPEFPVTLINALDREGRFGDQEEFINAGLGAVRMTEISEDRDRQHNSLDTADLLNYDYLADVTRLNLAVMTNIIGAPPQPPQPQIAPMADNAGYILTWPPDEGAAGYAISFRPLTSDEYPVFTYVGANQAGNVAITNLDTTQTYGVSLAALDANGRLGLFTPEIIAGP